MSVSLIALHALNLLAPAWGLGGLLAAVELWQQRRRFTLGLVARAWATYTLAAAGVLVLGVAVWGQDGKVATYGALVLVLATLATWRMPTRP